jgi:hypothetical protein
MKNDTIVIVRLERGDAVDLRENCFSMNTHEEV